MMCSDFELAALDYVRAKLRHIKLQKAAKARLEECKVYPGGCYRISHDVSKFCRTCKESFRITEERRAIGNDLVGLQHRMYFEFRKREEER
jgi:hypothetical protein